MYRKPFIHSVQLYMKVPDQISFNEDGYISSDHKKCFIITVIKQNTTKAKNFTNTAHETNSSGQYHMSWAIFPQM